MEYNSSEFRKWLDKLQQESWQLELIISGFAIYGLISAYTPLEVKYVAAQVGDFSVSTNLWVIGLLCCQILIFNLVLHVLLRGLWIGAIGLRYVSGDIDYEKLNYSEKFTTYLKTKVGSFDKYIAKLENYCSVLFSVSFLLIFYVIGFFAVFLFVGFIISGIELIAFISEENIDVIQLIILGITMFFALIVFIDFVGQGFLKKKKWTSKLYFPIYWVFSKLTLSFLYRPIAYNFLDNKFGKRVSMLLVPLYIIIGMLTGLTYANTNYLTFLDKSTEYYVENSNYDDESTEEMQFIDFASIPSKVINTPYLKIFLKYNEVKEDFIFEKNPELKPEKDLRGVSHEALAGFRMGAHEEKNKDSINQKLIQYIKTVESLYKMKIDSIFFESNFIISKNRKEKIGFETYLNIRNMQEGKHLLSITGPIKKGKETHEEILVTIPFWYYPENPTVVTNRATNQVDSTILK